MADPSIRDNFDVVERMHDFVERHDELSGE